MFWGKEVKRLKVGITIPQKKWSVLLSQAVNEVCGKPEYTRRVRQCAALLAKENGRKESVSLLESFVYEYDKKEVLNELEKPT